VVTDWVIVRKGVFIVDSSTIIIIPIVGRSWNSLMRIKFSISQYTLIENMDRSFHCIDILFFF